MHSLLAYIVQVNLLLAILYVGYAALLKNLTFYRLNRFYLLAGVAFAFLYPFVDIKAMFRAHIEPVGELIEFLPALTAAEASNSLYTLENLAYAIVVVGGLVFLSKLFMQMLSLLRIHRHSRPDVWQSYLFRNVLFPIAPFSFLNKIYLHKEQHQETELVDVFEHESIHVEGKHSFDIILFEILLIVCWYNPIVWMMRKAVRQNLEFLTDQQVLDRGVDRQLYQYSLLKVSTDGLVPQLTNQFNFKHLKTRIMMMNKKRSRKIEMGKYVFLLPFIIFSAAAFTVTKADAQITEVADLAKDTKLTITPTAPVETAETTVFEAESVAVKQEADTSKKITVIGYSAVDKDASGKVKDTVKVRISSIGGLTYRGLRTDGVPPLIVVDGEEKPAGYDFKDLNVDDIFAIKVIKDADATDGYGARAAAGVIDVTTKARAKELGLEKNSAEKVFDIKGSGTVKKQGNFGGRSKFVADSAGLNVVTGGKVSEIKINGSPLGEGALFVLDGVPMVDGNTSKLDPDNIESISVLKGESASAIYGEKGKKGVVLITSKAPADASKASAEKGVKAETVEITLEDLSKK